jgi:hypothetical protein
LAKSIDASGVGLGMSIPQKRAIGVSLQVDMPLGDYNNENTINTGAKRRTIKPEIGISNRWSD